MFTRLLIADDHRMFREGLRAALAREGFEVVAEAADGREAVRQAAACKPDLAVVDVSMPGLNGVDAVRELLRVRPGLRVVVVTMHRDEAYFAAAMRAGARGYVLKSQPIAELVGAIQDVVGGGVYVPPGLWGGVVDFLRAGELPREDPLTPREREVLQLIAEGRSTKEIARTLNISYKTAESHRSHLMGKLDIHETASLVRYAIRKGLLQA